MATGKPAFSGRTKASLIASILSSEPPPISTLQPMTPPALDRVVKRCLAKDPDDRWQSASDLAAELRWVAEGGSQMGVPVPEGRARRMRFRLGWGVAASASAVAIAFAIAYFLAVSKPATVIHAQIPQPEKVVFDFTGDLGGPTMLSPDGRRLVFAAHTPESTRALWVRPLDSDTAQSLEGTDGAFFPFWSEDSRSLGFFADAKLKKIAASGGPVTTLADASNARVGAWGRDDVIIFSPDFREALYRIPASGGHPTQVTTLDATKHTTHRWPFFLPDGKHFLYLATNHSGGSRETNGIYFGSLDGKESKLVVPTEGNAQYASGYLLFQSQAALVDQPFDPSSGRLSGEPVPVADKVQYDSGVWRSLFTTSENGMLAYQGGNAQLGTELTWLDRTGKLLGKVGERERVVDPRLSPDGRRLAVVLGDPLTNIWVLDLERGTRTRLTFDSATHNSPSWSADGSRVAFASRIGSSGPGTGGSIHAIASNGTGTDELLLTPEPSVNFSYPQWSPDGRYLIYERNAGPTGGSIWAVAQGEKKPFPVAQPQSPQGNVSSARLSPDGHWFAYTSTDSGRTEVYVAPFPGGGGRWQISTQGGDSATWRRDGKELYFLAIDNFSIAAVEVGAKGAEFHAGTPHALFRVNVPAIGLPYDVSPDGQCFLVNNPPLEASTPISLVVNWTAEVKK